MRLAAIVRGYAARSAAYDSALNERGQPMRERRPVTLIAGILAACMICGGVLITVRPAQSADPAPSFLVATPEIPDPVFEQSVILMLPPAGSPLVAGIIVNKPTTITLERLFPHAPMLKNQGRTAYFGGPVDLHGPSLVLRTSQAPVKATRLFDDVYVSTDTGSIAGILGHARPAGDLRLFFGRAQWTPDQLHSEILAGAWYIVPAKPDVIFSSDPASVWHMLVQRALHEAGARPIHDPGPCARGYESGLFTRSTAAELAGYTRIDLFFGDDVSGGVNWGACQRWPVESALR
jgi:putative transcriptional regulator